jgi:hypothetical protein
VGQIILGTLHAHPRPAALHAMASSELGSLGHPKRIVEELVVARLTSALPLFLLVACSEVNVEPQGGEVHPEESRKAPSPSDGREHAPREKPSLAPHATRSRRSRRTGANTPGVSRSSSRHSSARRPQTPAASSAAMPKPKEPIWTASASELRSERREPRTSERHRGSYRASKFAIGDVRRRRRLRCGARSRCTAERGQGAKPPTP